MKLDERTFLSISSFSNYYSFFLIRESYFFFHLYKETKGGLGQSIIEGCGSGFRIRALRNGSLKRFEGHEGFTDRPDLVVFQLGV